MEYADEADMQAMRNAQQKPKRYVRFSMVARKNEKKSTEAGRPIFDDLEYVEIMTPGDKQNIIHRPIRAADIEEFGEQYRRWKAGAEEQQSGTLLSEWPGVTRSQVEELAYFKIRTVEQLADLSDGNAAKLGAIQALREKARDYVAKAKAEAPLDKVRAENADLKNEVETMKRQLAELSAASKAQAEKRKGA